MKIIPYLLKQKNMVIKFVHLQLFVTLISIPILLCWGMPISVLTFAGNLFFSPILTAFLLFSSLIFFCQLLNIPNGIFIYCLEYITQWWLSIMQWGTKNYLVALPLPPFYIIIAIPIITLAILHHKKVNTAFKGIACYGIFLLSVFTYLLLLSARPGTVETLECNKGILTFVNSNKQLVLIDPGVIGRRLSAPSWCEYTLMPHLVKKYGTNTIDHLILLQPNKIIFDAVTTLQEKITIKNIYLMLWEGKLPFYRWCSYAKLKEQCKDKQCAIKYLGKKSIHLELAPQILITITPLDHIIQMEGFSYPALHVEGILDNHTLDIYSAKYSAVVKKN